ncbi:MAG: ImmA/IrrE family metallo-endopeptidase [Candidatus Delongbacteria bacterium]|jgi:HTH-type transcriptional regulator/antitoxin HigA|nr:ImmA/IrrE family metallo-endopeptidase [Candidatus Delongbacteria bacterium]
MKILGLPVAPGITIIEQLDTWGISRKEFALRMDYSEKHMIDILKGKSEITVEIANRLESVLGIPADFWLGLEQNYRLSLKKKEEEDKLEEEEEVLGKISYKDFANQGWVQATRKKIEQIRNLKLFFGVAKLSKIQLIENVAFRISSKCESSSYAIAAWLRKGQIDAREKIDYPEFDKYKILTEVIPEIKRSVINETDIFRINKLLSGILKKAGIYFTITTNISKASINGAVTWINKRPLIQMSLKGKYADIFWFTLFHELGHVYYEHSKKEVILDLSNESTGSEVIEKQADIFAVKFLYPKEFSLLANKSEISKSDIVEFAKKHGLPVGIIVGRLMHDKVLDWGQYSELRVKF